MSNVIMIGCDLHDEKMVLKIAEGKEAAVSRSWETEDVEGLIGFLKSYAGERWADLVSSNFWPSSLKTKTFMPKKALQLEA